MPTLTWIGKEKVVNHHQEVSYRVLEHKYGFRADDSADTTPTNSGNKIIHGDNLEALKSLLPEYEGRIKCIYIDPPYNTGNEKWVYNDNVNDPKIKKWLGEVVGKQGEDLSRHDKWLCMMYPRLKLLHKLLADDGVIFISIDVFEFATLKLILDEIFGSSNFRNCIAVRRGIKNVQAQFEDVQTLSLGHEYIFLYSKDPTYRLPKLAKIHDTSKPGKWDTFWRGTDRPTMRYTLFGQTPDHGQWRWEATRGKQAVKNYEKYLSEYASTMSIDDYYIDHLMATNEKLDFVRLNNDNVIQYYVPPQTGKLLSDNWMDILLSGSFTTFDTEKSVQLLDRIINWICEDQQSIILDSFAGSGTTAHAVLNLNKKDGGNRKFILIEMEDYAENITAERVCRVMNGYGEGKNAVAGTGGAFDFYELGAPMFDQEKNLNEEIDEEKIREYIYYTETKRHLDRKRTEEAKYLLDTYNGTGYYFYYEKDYLMTLSIDTLSIVTERAEQYVIYADICTVPPQVLAARNITFKKIPRDIKRF